MMRRGCERRSCPLQQLNEHAAARRDSRHSRASPGQWCRTPSIAQASSLHACHQHRRDARLEIRISVVNAMQYLCARGSAAQELNIQGQAGNTAALLLQQKAHLLLLNSSFGPCLPKQRYGIAFSLQRKQTTLTNATPTTASTAVTIMCGS